MENYLIYGIIRRIELKNYLREMEEGGGTRGEWWVSFHHGFLSLKRGERELQGRTQQGDDDEDEYKMNLVVYWVRICEEMTRIMWGEKHERGRRERERFGWNLEKKGRDPSILTSIGRLGARTGRLGAHLPESHPPAEQVAPRRPVFSFFFFLLISTSQISSCTYLHKLMSSFILLSINFKT